MKRIKGLNVTDFCREYPEPKKGSRRQDFEPCYIRNGAIYATLRDVLINDDSFIGKNSHPYVMNKEKSINIDTISDLYLAQIYMNNIKGK